ncbi:MAG: DUF433 domain-containing protein [Armatimonadetes bacterium]|nr:DUF433 domain-containing protein [Armatimonadota bacterium]
MNIYGGRDPRAIPTYTFAEAAHYLRAPDSTLRSWARGQQCRTKTGTHPFEPVIDFDDPDGKLLSFTNLVELHVLIQMRRVHGLQLPKVRHAIRWVGEQLRLDHPLARQQFQTDGVDLLVEHYGTLVAASAHGQLVMREIVVDALRRIERDAAGLAVRLFPYTRQGGVESPRLVVLDPRIAFGRPVLVGTGIPTVIVAERFKAGEEVASLARDYERAVAEIEEAIRCELPVAA